MRVPCLLIEGSVLVEGSAEGKALCLDASLSFWGGFDPVNGEIIDVHHPQYGVCVRDSVLFIPASRGSAGTPAGIAESLRLGSGPRAVVLAERDVNIAIGVLTANRLYDLAVPVIEIGLGEMRKFRSGDRVSIDTAGRLGKP